MRPKGMKNNTLTLTRPAVRRWVIPVSILATLALSWVVVQNAEAYGDRNKDEKVKVEKSKEHKAFLGILMQELDSEVLEGLDTKVKRGVLVTDVIEGSPADKAGIEEGDIIVEINGRKVDSPDELQELVAKLGVGDEIEVELARGSESKTLDVTLGDWADQPAMAWVGPDDIRVHVPNWDGMRNYVSAFMPRRLGVRVSEVNEDLGSYFGVSEGEGVLVLSVEDESTAEGLGVKAGDVIVKVEDEDVDSARDIRESLSEVEGGDEVNVTVVRKKKKIDLKGEMKEGSHASWFYNWRDHAPRVRAFSMPDHYQDELRKELDELRKEIEELKKELRES